MVKYSIIVPVYNVDAYLDKCFNSLVNQNNDNYEIIVVNDGSTDNSQNIINEYKNKYPKLIKAYKKENEGLSSARNYGIDKANGEYLLFVDSDDYVSDNYLNILDNYVKSNNPDILVFNFNAVNDNLIEKKNTYFTDFKDLQKKFLTGNPSACNKLIKKDIFIKNNIKFMENVYYEDLATIPSLVCYTSNICFIDDYLYYYVIRDNSITNKRKFNTKMDNIFEVLDYNYKLLINDFKEEVEYLYIEHLLRCASLRYMEYKKYEQINKINNIIKNYFPKWYKNIYYKKNYDIKKKFMCYLIYKKKFKLISLLRKK